MIHRYHLFFYLIYKVSLHDKIKTTDMKDIFNQSFYFNDSKIVFFYIKSIIHQN